MFQENIPLSCFSHYKIGGKARYFFEAKTAKDLEAALSKAKGLPIFILGAGTNVLFDDSGFGGLVLKPNLNYIKPIRAGCVVGVGTLMPEVLNYTVTTSLSGLEWAGGLPGTLGGAIRGNAGCFGGEIKDIVASVNVLEIKNQKSIRSTSPSAVSSWANRSELVLSKIEASKIKNFNRKECKFGYRTSIFKEYPKWIILEATLALKRGNKKEITKAIQEKINYRLARHPIEYPNVGSIFKNVSVESLRQESVKALRHVIKTDPFPVVPAAYLISEAGLKGVSFGGAMISGKHPNFIVNAQSASSEDVKKLISLAKEKVLKKFNIELEEEVQMA